LRDLGAQLLREFVGRGGRTWTRVEGLSSVGSILVDPRIVSRVLVAKAPGRWKSGVREGVLGAGIVVQGQPGAPRRPLTPAPPHGSASQIQLAGFFGDGALAVQVDGAVYELGRDNLARRLPGWHRRVARRSEERAPPRP